MLKRVLLCVLAASPVASACAADPSLPRQRPLTDRRFEATDERRERGQYLAEHLLQCFICHSERNWDQPGAPPIESRKGAGVVLSENGERRIVAPNITPDVATGAGAWSDDMLARAIREGIGHDGRALYWGMWYQSFAALSDEDLAAVVVYVRSIPAVRNALPATRLPIQSPSPRPWPVRRPATRLRAASISWASRTALVATLPGTGRVTRVCWREATTSLAARTPPSAPTSRGTRRAPATRRKHSSRSCARARASP
jgi:mono/diheme cytochrome c family protein